MKTGIVILSWEGAMDGVTPSSRDVIGLAQLCESVGLDSAWITDHFYFDYSDLETVGVSLPEEMHGTKSGSWECWALVSAIAAVTERINIGTLVSATAFRNPSLLARSIDTIDDLSGGRLIVGLGAGDFPFEHESFGYPVDRPIARFEEAIQIISKLLKGQEVTFSGEFYQTRQAKLIPKGCRPNGPPLLVGSVYGRPRMTRLTVEYGDYWNCFLSFTQSTVEAYREGWVKLQNACHERGRDPATIKRNVSISVNMAKSPFPIPGAVPISGSADKIADSLAAFRDEGIEHSTVVLHPLTPTGIESFARAVEKM